MEDFLSERGRRGRRLPRGFRNVDRLEVVTAPAAPDAAPPLAVEPDADGQLPLGP
jgi:hypothetical protein